jgi:hypothetical protein
VTLQQPVSGRNYVADPVTLAAIIPAYLRDTRRWTAWSFIGKGPGAKPAKKPHSLTNDQKTWKTFSQVLTTAGRHSGIGFQMLGVTTIVGIDLDGCVEEGVYSEFAASLLATLPDTYAEITPSGKGLRIFAQLPDGMAPPPEFLSRQHGVECYVGKSARFLTVTGNPLPGRAGAWGLFTDAARRLLGPMAASAGGGVELEVKLATPSFERVETWQSLLDDRLRYTKLPKVWRDYLESGDLPGGRSEKTYAIACKLLEVRYHADEVFAFLVSAPGPFQAALDKRDQDVGRARDLIWADIGRAQRVLRAEDKGSQELIDSWQALGLKTYIQGKKVVVQTSQMNGLRVLTLASEWANRLALDITTGAVLLDNTHLDDGRFFELHERVTQFCAWERPPNRQWWTDLVRAAAEKNPLNPREAYLRALVWDGTPRLDSWFTDCVALEDDKLNRDIGRKWLLSLVARWLNPGCKCDTVLILQGVEGARKNTFFEVLAGAPERVVEVDGMEREDKMLVAQSWIAEMPEAGLFRRSDRNRLKNFITKSVDHYRIPYAASPVAVKRAFVLVSTANPGDLFQADQDGLRRFWPVEVRGRIDYEQVERLREQLFAEAVLCLDLAEPWWFETTPAELAERVQDSLEASAVDDAIVQLISKQAGKGGLHLLDIVAELMLVLGHRPADRLVTPLLWKHGIRQRRTGKLRFWLHPSWARAGQAGEADVIPLRSVKAAPAEAEVDVLS